MAPHKIASRSYGPAERTLYVGSLDLRVTRNELEAVAEDALAAGGGGGDDGGHVVSAKVILDVETQGSAGYGFIEFSTRAAAQAAMPELQGRLVRALRLRINWAVPSSKRVVETDGHVSLFVGDLCKSVDDDALHAAFAHFPSLSSARVMWDVRTGTSREFGFVSFGDPADADAALATMAGVRVGKRRIRINSANKKTHSKNTAVGAAAVAVESGSSSRSASADGGGPRRHASRDAPRISQAGSGSASVVVSGIRRGKLTFGELEAALAKHGEIDEMNFDRKRGVCTIAFEHHDQAVSAIVGLHGWAPAGCPPLTVTWASAASGAGASSRRSSSSRSPASRGRHRGRRGRRRGRSFSAASPPGAAERGNSVDTVPLRPPPPSNALRTQMQRARTLDGATMPNATGTIAVDGHPAGLPSGPAPRPKRLSMPPPSGYDMHWVAGGPPPGYTPSALGGGRQRDGSPSAPPPGYLHVDGRGASPYASYSTDATDASYSASPIRRPLHGAAPAPQQHPGIPQPLSSPTPSPLRRSASATSFSPRLAATRRPRAGSNPPLISYDAASIFPPIVPSIGTLSPHVSESSLSAADSSLSSLDDGARQAFESATPPIAIPVIAPASTSPSTSSPLANVSHHQAS